MRKIYSALAGVLLGLVFNSNISIAQSLLTIQPAQPDSIVQLVADAQGLERVAPADWPRSGTFWNVMPGAGGICPAPFPCPPLDPNVPVYAIADGQFLVDGTGGQVLPVSQAGRMATSATINSVLEAQANTVVDLIARVQEAQFNREFAMTFGLDEEMYSPEAYSLIYDTNGLWLEITNVVSGLAHVNLHHATNKVYEIWSKTDLIFTNWSIELEVAPTNGAAMPFTVPVLGRTNLFIWARDWTGITSHGNTIPEWWFWKYFGTVNLSDTNLDSRGNTLLSAFQQSLDPNVIQFSLQFTNSDFNSSPANGTVTLQSGVPSYLTVLLNDTNLAHAIWQPYTSATFPIYFNNGNGAYHVLVGLRGLPSSAQASWAEAQLTLNNGTPTLVVTNPTNSTVSVPLIQLQGYVSTALSKLTYDVSNAAGIFTNQQGYWHPMFYNTNLLKFTTNSFQCYDVRLTNGLNRITLHATDVAGNTATTNFSYTLDYSGDHIAPALSLIWPTNGISIAGSAFTVRAQVDDATATVTATINSNIIAGLVERDGAVWFNSLPLNSGTNTVTITATDAAGNTSMANLNVVKSAISLNVNPLADDQLNQPSVTVSGTIGDSGDHVTVNGVSATVSGNNWTATNVPVSPDGTASLNVIVSDSGNNLLAAQNVYQPQPAKVVLASYQLRFHENSFYYQLFSGTWHRSTTETIDNQIYWSFSSGGAQHYDEDMHDIEDPPNIFNTNYPAGINAFSAPWENAATAENFDVYVPSFEIIWDDANQIKTHVMIDPTGQTPAGGMKLYLIRAKALEYTNTTHAGFLPLPPEWLQINGQALINSGMTNSDGAIWGETLVSAPAGVPVDVTPTATQLYGFNDYTFTNQAFEVDLQPAVDANRDGGIAFDISGQINPDQTTANQPYRFWVNDDEDTDGGDVVPVASRDCDDYVIIGRRDLEDLSRLWINTAGISEQLRKGHFLVGLKWKNAGGSPSINIFQAVETNGGTLYLTDTNVATQQAPVTPLRTTVLNNANSYHQVDTSGTFLINSNFWQSENVNSNNPFAHLLFEGCAVGKGQLVATINKRDGTELAEAGGVWLDIKDIKSMYQRAVATPASDSVAPPYNLGGSAYYTNSVFDESNLGYSASTSIAFDKPADETPQCVVFVHGWNMPYDEYLGFSETVFKRLYWQGYKGRFSAFYWETLTSPFSYNDSEFRAWKYGLSLKQYVEALKAGLPSYTMNIAAHSMGNIVTGSALNRGLTIDNYVLMQAAVPAGCYDTSSTVNNYSRFTSAESSSPTPDNAVPNMGYRGYLSNVTGNLVNFYNPFDFALATGTLGGVTHLPFLWWFDTNWEANEESYKPAHFTFSHYAYDSTQPVLQSGQLIIEPYGPTLDHYVTDPQEMMSFVARPRSKAVGALADVGGTIKGQVDLNARFGFDDKRDEHSAEFNWNIQRLNGETGFYHTLYNVIR